MAVERHLSVDGNGDYHFRLNLYRGYEFANQLEHALGPIEQIPLAKRHPNEQLRYLRLLRLVNRPQQALAEIDKILPSVGKNYREEIPLLVERARAYSMLGDWTAIAAPIETVLEYSRRPGYPTTAWFPTPT